MLRRLDSGLFMTLSVGDVDPVQKIYWLDDNGTLLSVTELNMVSIIYAYAHGNEAVLVEAPYDNPALIAHPFTHANGAMPTDTFYRPALPGSLIDRSFADRNGEFFSVYITAREVDGQSPGEYWVQPLRYTRDSTIVYDNQLLEPHPVEALLWNSNLTCTPDGGLIMGVFDVGDSNRWIRFNGIDAHGQLSSRSRRQDFAGDPNLTGLDMRVIGETVYAEYTTYLGADSTSCGAWFMGFPLDNLLSVPPPVELPSRYNLTVYPNPFNGSARVNFDLPQSGTASVRIFDISGRAVNDLAHGVYDAGSHDLFWKADNLPSGTYLIRLTAPGVSQVQKAVLLR